MTPEQAASLRHFTWSEFRHPEGMDFAFVQFLDAVRTEYGFPIELTSDFRTVDENDAAPGSVPTSRHLVGQAVDIKFPQTKYHLFQLIGAAYTCRRALPIEVRVVSGPTDHHVHLAFLKAGQASAFEVALT